MPFDRKGYDEALERVFDKHETYRVIRFYHDRPSRIMQTGLTLEEAREHCTREDTHGDGWFDGYMSEGLT